MSPQTRKFAILAFITLFVLVIGMTACQAKATESEDVAKPSNPGGPGSAASLTGDVTRGEAIFVANCVKCHGDQGKIGVANDGSTDGTVPSLNPIDETLVANSDVKVNIKNIDLFIEHGSTPEGTNPALSMPKFGDDKTLQPQEIADVIAYVLNLNKK